MSDLIERSEVLKQLRLNHKDVVYIDKNECARRIEAIPSARPKGEWIHNPQIGWGETWVCSICGEKTTSSFMGKPRYEYCPMCGADMRERKESE